MAVAVARLSRASECQQGGCCRSGNNHGQSPHLDVLHQVAPLFRLPQATRSRRLAEYLTIPLAEQQPGHAACVCACLHAAAERAPNRNLLGYRGAMTIEDVAQNDDLLKLTSPPVASEDIGAGQPPSYRAECASSLA